MNQIARKSCSVDRMPTKFQIMLEILHYKDTLLKYILKLYLCPSIRYISMHNNREILHDNIASHVIHKLFLSVTLMMKYLLLEFDIAFTKISSVSKTEFA